MNKNDLNSRLQELGIYNDFYYRREMRPLTQILYDWERVNCIFTGVNQGYRKLVAVTEIRIIIIFAAALGSGEIKVIRRSAVTNYGYEKKLLFGSAFIETESERLDFSNTQRGLKELFDWAMARPIPESSSSQEE